MNRWKNKVAIVTGASSGIGAAITEKLIKEEIIVVGLDREQERLEELRKKLNKDKQLFYPFVADVTKEEDILKAFQWTISTLGLIHVLVNNAGIVRFASLTAGETDEWREVFDTNVMALCITTREAIKNMTQNNVNGHIVHINSVSGHSIPFGTQIYGSSKYAVTALTETLRQELISQGSKIKVTSISPGFVHNTNIFNAAFESSRSQPTLTIEDMVPTDTPCLEPEDVADSVLYTLSTPPHVQIHELMIKPVGETF